MVDAARVQLARSIVAELPKFGGWANSFRDFETPYGKIGFRQAAILWAIRYDLLPTNQMSPSGLADFQRVRPSVITRALARLEAGGYIGRSTDPHDGRRSCITMTERGGQISAYVEDLYTEDVLASIAFLDDEDVEELGRNIEILARIVDDLERRRHDRAGHLDALAE